MQKSNGIMRFPCCPKEKIVYSETDKGWISVKCPNCGKFVVFYIGNNRAEAAHRRAGVWIKELKPFFYTSAFIIRLYLKIRRLSYALKKRCVEFL